MKEEFKNRNPGIIEEGEFKKYAVLTPILKTDQGVSLLFEKRSNKLNHQPGEICFPGGKLELGESLQECAVRETMEELCINSEQIKILGPGDFLVSPFNLIIYPYIGILEDYRNTFSTDEVAEIITIPLKFFRDRQPEKYKNKLINMPTEGFPYEHIPGGENYPWANGTYDILFYHYNEYIIWGMTARIVHSVTKLIYEYNLLKNNTMLQI